MQQGFTHFLLCVLFTLSGIVDNQEEKTLTMCI